VFVETGEPGLGLAVTFDTADNADPVTGSTHDGVSGVFLWQGQCEVGSSASSPIYTTAIAVETRAPDNLSFPYAEPPQEMTVYSRRHALHSPGATYVTHAVGGSSAAAEAIFEYTSASSYFPGRNGITGGGVNLSPQEGDLLETAVTLRASGSIQLAMAKNGGPETLGAETPIATPLPPSWNTPVVWLNSDAGGLTYIGFTAFRDIIIAKGVRDLAYFRDIIEP
jgi:hypothetical protein